ncbi:MAG TPA: hypothetical protein VM658_16245, partial [bacterium]|nr:hypothetical protein [bacterium]
MKKARRPGIGALLFTLAFVVMSIIGIPLTGWGQACSGFTDDFETGMDGWSTAVYPGGEAAGDWWHVTGLNSHSPANSLWFGSEG